MTIKKTLFKKEREVKGAKRQEAELLKRQNEKWISS